MMGLLDVGLSSSFGYPPPLVFVPFLVLLFLAAAAFVDARTGKVPDALIGSGLLLSVASLAWGSGWFIGGERLLYVVASIYALKLINNLYYRLFNHDAFGFGDAKWTGLAVAGFGLAPVCWAWIVGAWLALFWMGLRSLWLKVHQTYGGHSYVHFVPFLFSGLCLALYKDPLLRFAASLVAP